MDIARNRFGELFEALSLSTDESEPLHRRLYGELRQAIVSGRVTPGSRLPSSREFARNLGLSRNTVNTALAQLIAEGHVRSISGSGIFVA
ncbi:MAG: winged helix-turn-helix transcriptional regulator, partial [Betaproteobacteria bacterium]|nr:winged helix-turn-helix transcriptional regulator [Betaproteobacteria bacterium]